MKRLNLMATLLVVIMSSLFATGCSTSDESRIYCTLYADNVSANVIENDKGVTTEAYFTALNQKLQSSSGWYDNAKATQESLPSVADKAVDEFEQTTMLGVSFYGRFTVGYQVKGAAEKTALKEYTNKALGKADLTKALTKIAAANPDGFTVDAITLEPVTKGFAVSLEATQNSFGAEGLAKVIDYVTSHEGTNAYGGWLNSDNGAYYYDATIVCKTREEAEALGRQNNQIAIFDLENMEEIRL